MNRAEGMRREIQDSKSPLRGHSLNQRNTSSAVQGEQRMDSLNRQAIMSSRRRDRTLFKEYLQELGLKDNVDSALHVRVLHLQSRHRSRFQDLRSRLDLLLSGKTKTLCLHEEEEVIKIPA